jgi:hypothetical protein
MRFIALCIVFLLLAIPALAADVDGTWTGSLSGPAGDFEVSFTFKADGTKLTGTTLGFDGAPVQIQDGKVDGNNISYSVTFDFGGMPLTINYKGIVSGNEIKVSGEAAGMPFEFVLKKAK